MDSKVQSYNNLNIISYRQYGQGNQPFAIRIFSLSKLANVVRTTLIRSFTVPKDDNIPMTNTKGKLSNLVVFLKSMNKSKDK